MIGAVIQARMNSSRFPGKVLRPLAGKPMLAYIVESLQHADLDAIVVATSNHSSDNAIGRWCLSNGVHCYRGSIDDVANRLHAAGRGSHLEAIVRVSGDSPLLDHRIVNEGVRRFRESDADVLTNVFPERTCPYGQSVEVISLDALERALPLMGPEDHEHVTLALYRDGFEVEGFDLGEDLSGPSFAVDTPEDGNRIEALIDQMTKPHWEYDVRELLEL